MKSCGLAGIVMVAGLLVQGSAWAQSCPAGIARVTGGTPANPNGPGNFETFITGATVCAVRGGDRWQEFHRSGGALFDYKRGPNDAMDPTKQVGTWSASNGSSATLTHTYGGTSYAWALCLVSPAPSPSYTMVSPTAGTVTGVRVLAGQVACP